MTLCLNNPMNLGTGLNEANSYCQLSKLIDMKSRMSVYGSSKLGFDHGGNVDLRRLFLGIASHNI